MKLPDGYTKADIEEALEDWKEFEEVCDGMFGYSVEEGYYSGLCAYFEARDKDEDAFYRFLRNNYREDFLSENGRMLFLQPDTVETRVEVLEDILKNLEEDE